MKADTSFANFAYFADPEPPTELEAEAFHGVAGKIVRAIEPHTEADPAAVLIQLLGAFGNAVDRKPHFQVEGDKHTTNIYVVLVGETSSSRKGTSLGRVLQVMKEVDAHWAQHHISSGLSSGEGLIFAVRDPGRIDGKEDDGVADKRLLVKETEFASVLKVMTRQGNILGTLVRNAWDTGDMGTLTKNNQISANNAHISIFGHITRHELLRCMDATEAANGFGNRFLWVWVKRSKCLAHGGNLDLETLRPLLEEMKSARNFAWEVERVRFDSEASSHWEEIYPELSEVQPGLLGP